MKNKKQEYPMVCHQNLLEQILANDWDRPVQTIEETIKEAEKSLKHLKKGWINVSE